MGEGLLQEPRRRLDFEGAVNFRDMGGYPAAGGRQTRWRRLYRADSLSDLTAADLARLDALGLRTLIDFRLPDERRAKPDRLPPGGAIKAIELGFVPEGALEMLRLVKAGAIDSSEIEGRVIAQYRLFCVDHTKEYRRVFDVAMQAEAYPLLLHCTSGKDRTGYGVALLMLAVGVPRAVVLEDYDLTNNYRRPVPHLFGPQTSRDVVRTLLSAQRGYLEAALDEIDRVHGSFDAYLEKELRVDRTDQARLVDLLTEPNAP
jgi:protein-tyrosine phosphatase